MTQNEVDIIKNSVLDGTEAYVEARLQALDFVKTQIGVTVGNPTDINPQTHVSDGKYRHTVRCNATKQNPNGITYTNVLSVGNTKFPPNCVVFIVAPNAQFSNQFILGQLDDTPCNIVGGSIRLGGTNEGNAPIYLTSEAYQYHGKAVYGHIGSFYITQTGLRIEGNDSDISEITGKQIRLSKWDGTHALSMCMDIDNAYIAFNTNGLSGASVIISNAYGWDSNGNFNSPTNGNNYIAINPSTLTLKGSGTTYSIGEQSFKFLSQSQGAYGDLGNLRMGVAQSGVTFTNVSNGRSVYIPFD